ncbi:MAG: YfhO family protein [Candidatus Andersenbacteria bacterium]|nr:YfhO family protein [Candidatus Andersenbacteria bacterium]
MKANTWLVLVALVALLPFFPFLFGQYPAIGDMRDVFIPLESFFHTEEFKGHIPAWDPAVSFGFPVIAAAQIGFFYPVLFVLRLLPIWLELPLALVLHVGLLAIGTFLFARRLGMSKYASALTALSFSLSQFVWQHLTHLNIFLAIAWFPWQMLAVTTIFSKQKISARNIAVLVLLFGIPFLIGQIQIPFLMMLVALIYGMSLRLSAKRWSVSDVLRVAMLIAIIAIGVFLLSAIQLFPTYELSKLSSRGSGGVFNVETANQFSYPFYHLPTLLFPRFYGNDNTYWGKRLEIEYGFYIGVIPLMLAIWYLATRRPMHRFFTWLGVITFLLALGSLSPFRLLHIEPSLWIFSAPARWLLFTTFSLSIFAGFGFDALWKNGKSAQKFFAVASGIIFAGILMTNIALFFAPAPSLTKLQSMLVSARASSVSLASPYTSIAIISFIALPFTVRHKHGKKIILILSALDLIIIASTTTPTLAWKSILQSPATIQSLPQNVIDHQSRIYSIRDGGDTGAYFTDPSSRANAEIRQQQKDLLLPMMSAQFSVYGVEWPASLDIQEITNATSQLHSNNSGEIEDIQLAQQLNIGAVLTQQSAGKVSVQTMDAKPRFDISSGSVQLVSEEASLLQLATDSDTASTLIIRDTYYPNWHAYIDGNEVPIQKSPLFFRSIQVPAGNHAILMKYRQRTIRIGAYISCIAAMLLVIIATKKPRNKSVVLK